MKIVFIWILYSNMQIFFYKFVFYTGLFKNKKFYIIMFLLINKISGNYTFIKNRTKFDADYLVEKYYGVWVNNIKGTRQNDFVTLGHKGF